MAVAILTLVPLLIVYPFVQKHFRTGCPDRRHQGLTGPTARHGPERLRPFQPRVKAEPLPRTSHSLTPQTPSLLPLPHCDASRSPRPEDLP